MKKTKTLVIILNHNLPEYTDRLYLNLRDFRSDIYDLLVMDNGSKPENISEFTKVKLERNIYWGGALNEAFRMVLDNIVYDSLLFLNNDIEVNGAIFVNSLRHELFTYDFAIVSPCIAGDARPWKQMQNWGSKTMRTVKWIDNQAPLFHRKFIEEIRQFDPALFYGWGQELVCYEICENKGWKIGICDHITILHFAKQTLLQNRLFASGEGINSSTDDTIVGWTNYQEKAMASYTNYFEKHPPEYGTFNDLRAYGENYYFHPVNEKSGHSLLNIIKALQSKFSF